MPLALTGLGLLLPVIVFLSLTLGVRILDADTVIRVLAQWGQSNGGQSSSSWGLDELVVLERVPRTVFGLLAGASLGVSGALFQSVTRNSVADPGVLGVNTGSALFVVAGIAWFGLGSPMDYLWWSLAGAGLALALVYGLGSLGPGGPSPLKLALAGAVASAAGSSLISTILLPRTDVMNLFRFWQVGSLAGATWEGILTMLPLMAAALVLAWALSPGLDALALGDEGARGLGVRTGMVRLAGVGAGAALSAATTALGGPIGFVGLMVPHAVRMLAGPRMGRIVPLSALAGASLLLGADVVGRISGGNGEIEAGIITAVLGAPVLICLAARHKGGRP